jgi:hypothetical protein
VGEFEGESRLNPDSIEITHRPAQCITNASPRSSIVVTGLPNGLEPHKPITGRFDPPFLRASVNLVAEYFDIQDILQPAREDCAGQRRRGWDDQGAADALISAPGH